MSLWYRYADGTLECATGADVAIPHFLCDDSQVALEVSTNHPPYRGVRGAGTASLAPDTDKRILRAPRTLPRRH